MRRRIPFAITFRRPRTPEGAATPKAAKRAPITALWDEMVSGAPVDLATADLASVSLTDEPTEWNGWAVADDVEAPQEWSGWAVADDADEHHEAATEVVIRHVHGRTGPTLAVPFVQFAAALPRTRVPSGIYVVPLSTEIEQLDDTPEETHWDEPSDRMSMPIVPYRPSTLITPRPPRWRWHQGHVAVATLGLLLLVAAWRHSPTPEVPVRPTPTVVVAQAEPVQIDPPLAPANPTPTAITTPTTPTPTEPTPTEPTPTATPAAPTPVEPAPILALAEPAPAAPQFVADPDITPATVDPRDPDFDYLSARRYIDEQASYLRETCMHKGQRPKDRLRVDIAVQPGGVARIAVPGVSAEVRGCVRRVLAFPFDPSPRGAHFTYTLTATRSHLKPRSETTTG